VFFAYYEPRLRDDERRVIDGEPVRGNPLPPRSGRIREAWTTSSSESGGIELSRERAKIEFHFIPASEPPPQRFARFLD
jgi:hypothetical protein